MAQQKSEFRNESGGVIGIVTIEPGGKIVPIALTPGFSCWLSEEEQIATANAPIRDEDNPFANGFLVKVTDAKDIKNRRPIGDTLDTPEGVEHKQRAEEARAARDAENKAQAEEEAARLAQAQEQAARPEPAKAPPRQSADETAAPPQPQGKAAEGTRASGEEVGTPEAVGKG